MLGDLGEVERRLRALRTEADVMQVALDAPHRPSSPHSTRTWASPRSPGSPVAAAAGLDPNAPDFLARLADLKAQHERNLRELEQQLQRGGHSPRARAPAPRPRSAAARPHTARERPALSAGEALARASEIDALIASTRARRGADTSRLDAARQRWQQRPSSAPPRRPRPRATVPQPFKFEERDAEKRRKSAGRLAQRSAASSESEGYEPFRAHPVPLSTIEPRYERMVERAERRREQIVAERRETLAATTVPFSFHARPPVPRRRPPVKSSDELALEHTFKAKPVPAAVTARVYDQMQHEAALRKEKVAREAAEKLAAASLPPRMERHQQMAKATRAHTPVRAAFAACRQRCFAARPARPRSPLPVSRPPAPRRAARARTRRLPACPARARRRS